MWQGLVLLAFGLSLLMWGLVEATPSDNKVPVRHFAASSQLLDVLHDGMPTASASGFPGCPNSDELGSPVYMVTWTGGDRDVTIRVGDQIDVSYDSDAFYQRGNDSLCFVQSAGGGGYQVDTFQAVRPGSQIVFENRTTRIEAIKITVVSPVPTNSGGAALLMGTGGVLVAIAVVMLWVVYSRRVQSRALTQPGREVDRQRVYT